MRTVHRLLLALIILNLWPSAARADVALPGVFSNHMVLQRGREVRVFGTAKPGEKVSVRFRGTTRKAAADAAGRFEVILPATRAGGPFVLTVRGSSGRGRTLKDILVGDVWLCSGQSNMVFAMAGSRDSGDDIANSSIPGLRLFSVPYLATLDPQELVKGAWKPAEPATVRRFTAVGFYFGREIRRRVKVPIGLIQSAVGGTPAEAWTPLPALQSSAAAEPLLARWKKLIGDGTDAKQRLHKNRPGNLYNGMIHPLQRLGIRGAIWYQGESNAGDPELYRTLFPLMIGSWRESFGQGDFPFYFVQLPNYRRRLPEPAPSNWAQLRDAQFHTLKTVARSGMAVTIDIGEAGNIHPKNKRDVGIRLARIALAEVYGRKVVSSGPLFDSFEVRGNEIVLSFTHTNGGLKTATDGPLTGFAIAGPDLKFRWGNANIQGGTVVVSHPDIPAPTAVRYAWADNPECNLVNGEGLPASPFQTSP